jgi:hypothetical protein
VALGVAAWVMIVLCGTAILMYGDQIQAAERAPYETVHGLPWTVGGQA